MKYLKAGTLITLGALIVLPPGRAQTETLEFSGHTWRVMAQQAEVTTHKGREALALTGGRVSVDDAGFSDGVISFDAAYVEETIFVGLGWRADADGRAEEVYFRGHLNAKPDSFQYTPVENGLSAWQIYSDLNSTGPLNQTFDTWNKVKIVVEGDRADVYFNSDDPVVHIPDLKTDLTFGGIVLRSTGPARGTAYFSNLSFRPLQAGEGVVGTPKPMPELPLGLISNWQVSSPFDENQVADALWLDPVAFEALSWSALAAESNGIANLAKLSGVSEGADTVFIRLDLTADKAQMTDMRFGYSDRVRIYLNGKRVYAGNAGWQVRDYRFLGTVGFFDSVGLDLQKGDNQVLIAVSETFGGWAWAGAIEDQSGLSRLR